MTWGDGPDDAEYSGVGYRKKPPSAPKPAPNPRPKEGHDARHAQDFGNAQTEAIRQRLTYLSRVMRASCSFSHAFSCSRDSIVRSSKSTSGGSLVGANGSGGAIFSW